MSTEVEWNIKGVKARTLLGLVSPAYDRAWNPIELQMRPER